ncbi:uncharacterized protein AMSG_00859 [Thecamonas trahens ATCC 50062]|uniref:F-box domain-containing protein n=1 Tax=Thecamonas trahens ATCC 50062 TaxID=461836 RepID=A0A0L0DEP9_THETB|nr:hypothetical protein AMSG_00859 [Thecamonas trahens ATCC 50062]KNC50700.1 hypothetical protein AMSG_00859 [Thecamonas trahens ATCC 50062]|eukprot:XP_013762577.1 hypothetical protein AMSG_00859 [Thecamonas trahens ATCC 50062]
MNVLYTGKSPDGTSATVHVDGRMYTIPSSWLPEDEPTEGTWLTARRLEANRLLSATNERVLGLPDEVALMILEQLDDRSLAAASAVARAWHRLAVDSGLWNKRSSVVWGSAYGGSGRALQSGKAGYVARAAHHARWMTGDVVYLDPSGSTLPKAGRKGKKVGRGVPGGEGVDFVPAFRTSVHSAMISTAEFTSDGLLMTGGWDGAVVTYALGATGGLTHVMPTARFDLGLNNINALAVCDGSTFASAGGHARTVWDVVSAPWADGDVVLSCGQDARVVMWDVRQGCAASEMVAAQRPVVSLAAQVLGGAQLVYAAAEESTVAVYDARRPSSPLQTLELPGRGTLVGVHGDDVVFSAALSSNGGGRLIDVRPDAGDAGGAGPSAAADEGSGIHGSVSHFVWCDGRLEMRGEYLTGRGTPHGFVLDEAKFGFAAYSEVVLWSRVDADRDDPLGVTRRPRLLRDVGDNSVLGLATTDDLLVTCGEWIDSSSGTAAFVGNLTVRQFVPQ